MHTIGTQDIILTIDGLCACSLLNLSYFGHEREFLDLRPEFEYDALGRLIYSWTQLDTNTGDSDAREVWYYQDGGEAIAEYEPLGNGTLKLLRRHIRGTARADERAVLIEGHLGVPILSPQPTAECYYYILQDLDTVAAMMKQNGGLCESMVYAGYGKATTIGWPRGDFNRDGHVTPIDLAYFMISGLPQSGVPTPDPALDLDLDGDRDLADFALIQGGQHASPQQVPCTGNPYAFTGRRLFYYETEPDPNGEGGVTLLSNEQLQFNRNRWYDLATSRWLTRDPKGYVDAMSLYEYCKSNPTRNTDPMGTEVWPTYSISEMEWNGGSAWVVSWRLNLSEEDSNPGLLGWLFGRGTISQHLGYSVFPINTARSPEDQTKRAAYVKQWAFQQKALLEQQYDIDAHIEGLEGVLKADLAAASMFIAGPIAGRAVQAAGLGSSSVVAGSIEGFVSAGVGGVAAEYGAAATMGDSPPPLEHVAEAGLQYAAVGGVAGLVLGPVFSSLRQYDFYVTGPKAGQWVVPRSVSAPRDDVGIGRRIGDIHGALDPIAQAQRTTAILETSSGTRIVAGGARDLSPAQRGLLLPDEFPAKWPGAHAELTALQEAALRGLLPKRIVVSRPICGDCIKAIEATGGMITSPTTAEWPR